jgi:hypothetical protein
MALYSCSSDNDSIKFIKKMVNMKYWTLKPLFTYNGNGIDGAKKRTDFTDERC